MAGNSLGALSGVDQAAVSSHRGPLGRIAELCRNNDQGAAAGPASVPGSALGGPPGTRRAAHRQGCADDDDCHVTPAGTAHFRLPRLPIVQLAVTASRAALRAVARDGFATVDPATTHQGSAPARKAGQDQAYL